MLSIQLHDKIDILRKTREAVYLTCHRCDRKILYSKIVQNVKERRERFIHSENPRKRV